jgi:hypothetical protein
MAERRTDVVILGAGAAGLMCAIEAGRRGRHVIVLERNARIGRKILISGGGRCNFTNLDTRPECFLSANLHFVKSALARYTPQNFMALLRTYNVPYHEKKLGQLFCDRSAQDVVNVLESECQKASVCIETDVSVEAVERSDGFVIHTHSGSIAAGALVVATGGLSIPKIGATAFGYELAKQFQLGVLPCRPALVPLTFSRDVWAPFSDLAGVSLNVRAMADGACFEENLLFTHQGLSGPAILQASSYWMPGRTIEIDLLPRTDLVRLLSDRRAAGDRSEVRTFAASLLPRRLAATWFEWRGITKQVAALSDREIQTISDDLHHWLISPAGTEGYAKAEVTAGGIDTAEISSKTFESRKVPGLYFVGEVLDVTGHLGGFNFQWAWASGYAAGQFV